MKAIIAKKFEEDEGFKTLQNITLPLSALSAVNEMAFKYVKENPSADLTNVFIKIGQPCFDEHTLEVEIWENVNV